MFGISKSDDCACMSLTGWLCDPSSYLDDLRFQTNQLKTANISRQYLHWRWSAEDKFFFTSEWDTLYSWSNKKIVTLISYVSLVPIDVFYLHFKFKHGVLGHSIYQLSKNQKCSMNQINCPDYKYLLYSSYCNLTLFVRLYYKYIFFIKPFMVVNFSLYLQRR